MAPGDKSSTVSQQLADAPAQHESARQSSVGYGTANGHHGEILQGVFYGSDGRLCRGLVTLPCPLFSSHATFSLDSCGALQVEENWRYKARRAAELTLSFCDAAQREGLLTIKSNVPLRWGLGSSTCDVIAAIRAVADALDIQLSPAVIAQLAVQAEKASDATMFNGRAVLFGHRQGILIEEFGGPLPALEVVGFNTDPTGNGTDTLNFASARYSPQEIEAFRPLVDLLRRAISHQDPQLVAYVASASARINQRFLPKPHFDRLEHLVETVGALGLQVAHSGSIGGIVFAPDDPARHDKIRYTQEFLGGLGFNPIWHFATDG